MNIKAIFAVMNTTSTWVVVKIRPEKISDLYGIWTHDLSITSAYQYNALPTLLPFSIFRIPI